jgi:hypothetical protein
VNDWNVPGAVKVACMVHLVDLEPSVEQLAMLPLAHAAYRPNAEPRGPSSRFADLKD